MIENKSQITRSWMSIGKVEKIIVGVLFFIFLGMFTYSNYLNYFISQLDSAYMVENINTVYSDGVPRSHVNKTAHDAISTVIVKDAKTVCDMPLVADNYAVTEVFERHAYLSLYFMAPFRALFSGQSIAAFTNAFSFVGLVFLVYMSLRKQGLSSIVTLPFIFLLLSQPAWSASAFGQFYPDRLFLLVGFLYAITIHSRLTTGKDHVALIICVAALAVSIHERAALMISGFTFLSLCLYRGWNGWCKKDLLLLVVSIVPLIYAISYMSLIQSNSDYASFSNHLYSFFNSIENNERFRTGLEKFLLINSPLLILAVFEWRLALVAAAVMLPNVVGSIGGAEKVGWSTHYHSMYFPVLLAAATLGYIRLSHMLRGTKFRWVGALFPVAMAISLLFLDPYSLSPLLKFHSSNVKNNALVKVIGVVNNSGSGAAIVYSANFRQEMVSEIPEGSVVSTIEGMVPVMYNRHIITHYYPLGLANSDYIFLPYVLNESGELQVNGAISYLGKKNRDELNVCLNERIKEAGYTVKKKIPQGQNGSSGYVLLQRL